MKKIIVLLILISSYVFGDSFYYMNYIQNGKKGTSEITKEDYYKVINEGRTHFMDENNQVIKVINVYKDDYIDYDDYKTEQESIKPKTTTVHQEPKEVKKEPKVERTSDTNKSFVEEHLTAHRIFILIVILLFLKKYLTRKGFFNKKTVVVSETEEEKTEKVSPKKTVKKEVVRTSTTTTSRNTMELTYTQLNKRRAQVYNEFKVDDTFDKEFKKGIYRRLSQLRQDIKDKIDLSVLNQDLRDIEEDINNG